MRDNTNEGVWLELGETAAIRKAQEDAHLVADSWKEYVAAFEEALEKWLHEF